MSRFSSDDVRIAAVLGEILLAAADQIVDRPARAKPRSTSRSTMWLPMNPAPPVTTATGRAAHAAFSDFRRRTLK